MVGGAIRLRLLVNPLAHHAGAVRQLVRHAHSGRDTRHFGPCVIGLCVEPNRRLQARSVVPYASEIIVGKLRTRKRVAGDVAHVETIDITTGIQV